MSIDGPGAPAGAMGALLPGELGELVRAGLLLPWGSTTVGHRALVRLLCPGRGPSRVRHHAPVILVHGWCGHRANWLLLQLELRRAGFGDVDAVAYSPMSTSLGSIARALELACHEAMDAAGTQHLHLVGHSPGGIVVRHAVQRLGLAPHVRTAVTVAAPHRGTHVACLGWGPLARALRPGSPLLRDLDTAAPGVGVRWVNYSSDHDLIVRPESSRLDEQRFHALDVRVPDVGHLGILRAPAFVRSLVRLLLAAESVPPTAPGAALGPAAPTTVTAA